MANFNRQADNRKAKKTRRRRQARRTVDRWQSETKGAAPSPELERKIRELGRELRVGGTHKNR